MLFLYVPSLGLPEPQLPSGLAYLSKLLNHLGLIEMNPRGFEPLYK